MGKKKKKEAKVEKVFGKDEKNTEEQAQSEQNTEEAPSSDVDEFLGKEEQPEEHLTEKQKKKLENLNNVKNKISKILQSSNIEIVDENAGDEYEFDASGGGDGHSQEDYDSLKALFGDKEKGKKQELTLTIDDFDYSYIGQYLEEYDLMHMKNIKKVRIQKKHSPKLRKILIAAVLVIMIGVGAFLGFYFTRKAPVVLEAVSLNQTKSEGRYFVGDTFDYTGLYFTAEYSDGKKEVIKLNDDYFNREQTTGNARYEKVGEEGKDIQFVSNGSANLVFTYNGFNMTYTVSVERKNEVAVHALYSTNIFNIEANGFITSDLLRVFVEYNSYGAELVEFSNDIAIFVDGTRCTFNNNTKQYQVTNGTTSSSVIRITAGSKEVTLVYSENYI